MKADRGALWILNDRNAADFADGGGELLGGGAMRQELVAAGLARAAEFRWGDMVAAYRDLLESAHR